MVAVWRVYPTWGRGLLGQMVEAHQPYMCYGLEVCSAFVAKYLWVEYGQASEFMNLHLLPWRYW